MLMTRCKSKHRYDQKFSSLPNNQGSEGRHRCAGCAFEEGYKLGLVKSKKITVDLDKLPYSQAGHIRHKCPHTSFAIGYSLGVKESVTLNLS